jgi:hypothetical protein
MKTYGEEWRGIAPLFLTLALDEALPLYPGGNSPGTHSIGGWVGPGPGLILWRREKSIAPTNNQTATP